MSKVDMSEGTTKFRANHPEALEHIRSRFAGPLAAPLESEALRRGLISVDIPTLYHTLRAFHSDIFARISREVEPDALSSALATIVCDAVGQSIYDGADPEVISSELCNRLDAHSLFYCTIDDTFLGVQMGHLMRSSGRKLGYAYGSHRHGGGERDHHNKSWGYGVGGGGGNFHGNSNHYNNSNNAFHGPHPRHHSNPSGAHWPHTIDATAQHGTIHTGSKDANNYNQHLYTSNTRSSSDSYRQQQRFSQHEPLEDDGQGYLQKQDAPHAHVDGGAAPRGTDMSSAGAGERRYHTAHACVDFMHGKCARGDLCRFSHEPEAQSTTQRSNHYNAVMMNSNNNHNTNNNNHYSSNSTVNNSHHNTNIGAHQNNAPHTQGLGFGRGSGVATSREPSSAAFHSQSVLYGNGQHNFHQQQYHHTYGNSRPENHHHTSHSSMVDGGVASNLPTPTQTYSQGHHLPMSQPQQYGRLNGYSNSSVLLPRDIATASNSTSAASLMNAPHCLPTPSSVVHNTAAPPPPATATAAGSGPPPPPPEMVQSRRAAAPPPPPPQALLSAPPPPRSQSDAGGGTPTPSSPSTASSSSPLHSHVSNISANQKSEASVTLNPYPFRRSACASQSASVSASGGGGVAPPAPLATLPNAHTTNTHLTFTEAPIIPQQQLAAGTFSNDDDQPLVPFLEANGQAHLVDPLRNGGFTMLSQLKALTLIEFEQKLKVRICSRSIRSSLWDVLHPDKKGAISLPLPAATTTTSAAIAPVEPSGRGYNNKTNLFATTAKVGEQNTCGSGGTASILKAFLANNDIKSNGGESVSGVVDVTKSPSKAVVAAHALNSLLHVPVAVTSSPYDGNGGGGKTADTPVKTPLPSPAATIPTVPTVSSPTVAATAATATQTSPSAAQQQQQDIRAILWLRASLSTSIEEMKAAVATVGRFFECGLADYCDGGTQWAYFKLAAYDKELQAMKLIATPQGGRLVIADRTLFAGGHKDSGLTPLLPVEVRDRLVRSQDEPSPSPLPHPHPTRGSSRTSTQAQQSSLTDASFGGNLSLMGARANTHPQAEPKARGGPQREKGLPLRGRVDGAGEREKENDKDKEKAPPPVCRFFLRRSCTKGDTCPYRHDCNKQERTVSRPEY